MDGEQNGLNLKAKVPFHSRKRIDVDGLRPATNQGEKDDLYVKLWHACAGPSVYVPRTGEKVLYFPQGHMEQVEAYMNQDGTSEMPIYNLPSKILCRVVHAELKAEAGTDELFAQISLIPEAEQDVLSMEHRNYQALPKKAYSRFFRKKLTPSDTSTHGGFTVPKRHADDGCLPSLDMSQEIPQQELVAVDLHGFEWRFKHIFRGQPKRHLLTSGWSTFVTSKKLVTGDAFIFLRGENGELRVGIRRAMALLNSTSSVISGLSMRHGILASAFHAFCTRSMLTVYYRPWTSSSEFIIPLDQYMKSAEIEYSIGTRFRMQYEGEECGEQRALGTIISTEDVDHIRWPNSEWRCLKVKWDPTHDALSQPQRVCPWDIQPMEFTKKKKPFILHHPKRARKDDASSPGFSSLLMDGMWHGSVNYESQSSSGVLQGQEDSDTDVNQSGALRQPLPHLFLPLNPGWASIQRQMENQHEIQIPISNSFYQCTSNTALLSGGNIASLGLHNNWPSASSSYGIHDNALAHASRRFSVPNVNSQECTSLQRNENGTSLCKPNGGHRYMLFGVNLVNGPPELPSPQLLTSSELQSLCSLPPTSQSSVSEPSKSTSSKHCNNCCSVSNNCCSVSNRSCTKVLKYGTALGRSVDLTRFDGYETLISELDQMFDFKGRLIDGSSGWHVTYTDDEGDMMMINGDYPWQKFKYEVRRMLIWPKEEIDRLNSSSTNSTSH